MRSASIALPRCSNSSSSEQSSLQPPTPIKVKISPRGHHRSCLSRWRKRLFLIGYVNVSLGVLITIHSREFAHVAAFLSNPSSHQLSRIKHLYNKVVDDTTDIMNHDTQPLSSRGASRTKRSQTLAPIIDTESDQTTSEDSARSSSHCMQLAEDDRDEPTIKFQSDSSVEQRQERIPQSDFDRNESKDQIDTLTNTTITHEERMQPVGSQKKRPLSGLSRTHQSLLSKTSHMRRQRFVTGKYPLYVEVKQNPTKKWLGLAESRIYLNGTSLEKSLASYDIFHWLTNTERQELHGDYEFLSVELLAEIHVKKPGYVNILPKSGAGRGMVKAQAKEGMFSWKSWKNRQLDDLLGNNILESDEEGEGRERLWVTGFSLTKPRGEIHTVNVETGEIFQVKDRTARAIKWPNEVGSIPTQIYNTSTLIGNNEETLRGELLEDALLVTDGFLVPGKDKGGLYVVKFPGNEMTEWRVCLTDVRNFQDVTINGEEDWFYHRAIWMDLTGDGRQSILAARAKLPSILNNGQTENSRTLGKGQLVWLERPMPHTFDVETGTPLDTDGTVFDPFNSRNTPWKLRVLDEGPDVMFNVADLDQNDDTVEVIASQFFSKKLSLHSISIGPNPKVVFRRVIDDRCGSAFSSILADLDGCKLQQHFGSAPKVVDSGSTVESLLHGDAFSHVLVTSHECSVGQDSETTTYESEVTVGSTPATTINSQTKIDGGSLFAYRIPEGEGSWKTQPWKRSVIATGFKVQDKLSNMINPGAPGFCYTFFPTKDGDDPQRKRTWTRPLIGISGDCAESAYILRPIESSDGGDKSTKYTLMCEIKCKSTVGSLAIGYDNFYSEVVEQQAGYAKIYVPCYEQDKVLVFALGSGEDIVDDW